MASATIAKPGSEYGHCLKPCEHKDCAELLHAAVSCCRICGDVIGYERNYYAERDNDNAPVHASCLEDEVETKRKRRGDTC